MTTQPEKKIFVLKDRGGSLEKNWYIEYREGGKRIKKYFSINRGKTVEERRRLGEQFLRQLRREYDQPIPDVEGKGRIYAALEFERPHLEPKSYQTYKSKIDQLFRWLGPDALTTSQLRLYFKLYRQSHSQQGTYDCRRQLMTFFKKAGLEHLLQPIKIKKGQSQPLRYFQAHQRERILDYLREHDPMLFLHCVFIYFTAIRPRKELVQLRVDDIFWEERKLAVRGEFSKNHKTQFVGLAASFMPFIEHLKHRPPGAYIFPSKRSAYRPASRNAYGDRFRAVLDELGYGAEYQLYSWKHTGAVEVYRKTNNIIALQLWARHTDVRTTQLYLRQLGVEDFVDFYDEFPSPVISQELPVFED